VDSRGAVVAFVGPEGSGKSLAMCAYALMAHARGDPILTFPGWFIQDGREPDPEKRQRWSTEMEPADWLTVKALPRKARIFIDEAPQFFDSALFGTTTARMFGYVGTQRRKLDMSIYYTAQSWMHVHPRLRFPTHFVVVCRDQYYDPAQRADGRKRGEFINLFAWDVKGFVTGREWSPMGMTTLFAHHYWNYYDTEAVIDPADGMIQVQTKKQKLIYDASRAGEGPRIYKPGETLVDENGAPIDDAPAPPVPLTGDPSRDADLLSRIAATGQFSVKELTQMSRGLARGSR
jgi:hypothetical protein